MNPLDVIYSNIPLFAILVTIALAVKFITPVLLLKQKQKGKIEEPKKRKTLLESAEDFFDNAPQMYLQMQNLIDEQRKEGATEAMLKPLIEKQKWIGRIADPRYGGMIQSVAIGGIKYVKKLGLNI